jgi:hypothetical protein
MESVIYFRFTVHIIALMNMESTVNVKVIMNTELDKIVDEEDSHASSESSLLRNSK